MMCLATRSTRREPPEVVNRPFRVFMELLLEERCRRTRAVADAALHYSSRSSEVSRGSVKDFRMVDCQAEATEVKSVSRFSDGVDAWCQRCRPELAAA